MINTVKLSDLPKATSARISAIQCDDALRQRFYALGVHEEMDVQILHEGPINADPMAIDLDGHVVAIRRADAASIQVIPNNSTDNA